MKKIIKTPLISLSYITTGIYSESVILEKLKSLKNLNFGNSYFPESYSPFNVTGRPLWMTTHVYPFFLEHPSR